MNKLEFEERAKDLPVHAYDNGTWVCSCILSPFKLGYYLYSLYTPEDQRQKGYATALMTYVVNKYKVIYVKPGQYGRSEMSTEDLRAWYMRMGFVEEGDDGHLVKRR